MLLQQGLRGEAINLADASPNLLDLVAALDLPDAEGWAELCQRSDLPVPPPLQIERAQQLNDAYGQDQPLEELFATHRRLALCQAPLSKRLGVMRQIARADASPFWDKDLRTFEAARFKELRVGFAAAARDRDAEAACRRCRRRCWRRNGPRRCRRTSRPPPATSTTAGSRRRSTLRSPGCWRRCGGRSPPRATPSAPPNWPN